MVEPVIEASLLFFVLMMFVWGMLKAESEEMVLIINDCMNILYIGKFFPQNMLRKNYQRR